MRFRPLPLILFFLLTALGISYAEPVTPDASPEAKALLKAISRISGRNTLSGQHNLADTKSAYTEQVQKAIGKTPAIWSSDFGFAANGNDAITGRDAMIAEAKRQFNDGSIIALTWHAVRSADDAPSGLKNSVQAKLTDEQWQELLTAGSPLHIRWEAQVDVIAGYLKQLRDARIPVLWRPYPESNGSQYWWAGRPGETGSIALYKQLFKRLALTHKLNNLIWVWIATSDTQADAPESYYPGAVYCDILNKLSDFEWNELLTPGTELHKRWEKNIDTVALYLKRLQEAKIPVLWRPYHEANGNWFWWGWRRGENGYAALYRMTYDRMVNYHHLDNLVWVWNSNAPNGSNAGPYADFYSGRRFCDILATDVYGEFKQNYHDDLAALGEGIPIALGEVGAVPTPAVLKSQTKWAWFMVWADLLKLSKPEVVKELYSDPHTISRGEKLP